MVGLAHLRREERGFGMIEVLVSLFILLTGLLGLAGLLARSQQAEMESYQRAQALVLLQDMVERINANRKDAASYVGTYYPTSVSTCLTTGMAAIDLCQWQNALLGAAETTSGNKAIGAMIGARGCIFQLDAANQIYMVSVAWQGLGKTAAPTDSPACGTETDYGAAEQRRVVTAILQIARLYP